MATGNYVSLPGEEVMEGWWKFQKSRDNSVAQEAFVFCLQDPSEGKALFHL